MDDLKAKLDALSAKATQGKWVADDLAIRLVDEPADWNGAERDNVALMVELVNAYRTGQLIVAPELTAALQEAVEALLDARMIETIARVIDPSSWAVMDASLEALKRKRGWEHIGWPAGQFQHKESMAKAREIATRLRRADALSELAAGDADLIGENDADR